MHNPATNKEWAAEELRLHYERWEWGGRLPSAALRHVQGGSNVLGLVRFDRDLAHTLDAAGPEVQRAVALLAARLACEEAGLADKLWVAQALTALTEGRPLPPPFDDADQMRNTLRSDFPIPKRSALMAWPPERPRYCPPDTGRHTVSVVLPNPTPPDLGEISQPHFALPAVIAAADPTPLTAALDAVWHAIATYGEHYPELLCEIWSACPEQATGSAPVSPPRPYDAVALFPQLAPLARTATRLHPRPGSPTPHDSSIGGPLLWPANEPWPHCDSPHVVDGINLPMAPADLRSERRIRAASHGRSLTPQERETLDRIRPPQTYPVGPAVATPYHGPIAMLPVAQLYARDVPGLPTPEGADLLQVLWCPFDHPIMPRTELFWRSAASVTDILDTPPDPPATQFDGYLPKPCLLNPEQITEYPDHLELSKELRRQIENWSPWEIAEEGSDYKSSPAGFYDNALSAAPGWKLGGWPRWGATDPQPRPCPECGTEMDALLTIASFERNGEDCPWFARREPDDQLPAGFDPMTPTAVQIGSGYDQQLYVCRAAPEHPHIELMH
ncbi:hypothetical protein RI138_00125 [Streptomyces sp. C11-1]|uniref:DUF1963 domain-containing protein n=1 Tax=Streptomyces durocortorensis TaxID=2811104 RepID=A0ABY9VN22_9ACTN|nr:hypothetical protein [Streptomyces durocortorensis]WNF25331.1 hypothetical protein RI138_00125 [Streptomyces durocortorensis]